MRDRARRRTIFWTATGLLAFIALAIAAWPPRDRYHASNTLSVGTADTSAPLHILATIDASSAATPDAITKVVDAVQSSDARVGVVVSADASSADTALKQLLAATYLVRASAGAAATTRPGTEVRERADVAAAQRLLDRARAARSAAVHAFDVWRAHHRTANLARDPEAIRLVATRDAAGTDVRNASAALVQARAQLNAAPGRDANEMFVGPLEMSTSAGERSPLRLALAAVLLIVAICAADALFLTRTRLKAPHADETSRDRHHRRQEQRRRKHREHDSAEHTSALRDAVRAAEDAEHPG